MYYHKASEHYVDTANRRGRRYKARRRCAPRNPLDVGDL